MRIGFAILAVLLVPGTLAAQEVNRQEIRDTLRLPTIYLEQGLMMNTTVGPYLSGLRPDIKKEIAKIQKELRGDAGDAERYARLGDLLDQAGDSEQSRKASKHAVALFRQRLQADPDNARLLAQLGRTLGDMDHYKEAEASLRQAVRRADGDWRCWTWLGEYLQHRAVAALFAGKDFGTRWIDGAALAQFITEGKIDRKGVHKAEALLKESLACFDKAVELAPNRSEVFYRRAVCHFVTALVRPAAHAALGGKVTVTSLTFPNSPRAAHDFHRAAQLNPGDPLVVGIAACYQLLVGTANGRQLSDKDRQRVVEHLARLKQLAGEPSPEVAAQALSFLAFLHLFQLNDEDLAVKFYRQTLEIEPGNDSAWDMLTVLVVRSGRVDDAIRLCHERLKHKHTGHNFFLLAKAHAEKREWPQAEAALRAGLKIEPEDFYCTLGLAVALLQRDADAKTRKEAFARLHKASLLVGRPPNTERQQEVLIVEAAYNALYGEVHVARKKLQRLSLLEPDNDQVRQMLKAVGE
jgi:tetratricopeptide (TPR) repeat protein